MTPLYTFWLPSGLLITLYNTNTHNSDTRLTLDHFASYYTLYLRVGYNEHNTIDKMSRTPGQGGSWVHLPGFQELQQGHNRSSRPGSGSAGVDVSGGGTPGSFDSRGRGRDRPAEGYASSPGLQIPLRFSRNASAASQPGYDPAQANVFGVAPQKRPSQAENRFVPAGVALPQPQPASDRMGSNHTLNPAYDGTISLSVLEMMMKTQQETISTLTQQLAEEKAKNMYLMGKLRLQAERFRQYYQIYTAPQKPQAPEERLYSCQLHQVGFEVQNLPDVPGSSDLGAVLLEYSHLTRQDMARLELFDGKGRRLNLGLKMREWMGKYRFEARVV